MRLTIKRAGRSDVTVTSGDAVRKLTVDAIQEGDYVAMRR